MSEPIYQNHLVDPSYFYDAIEEFAFNYNWLVKSNQTIDDYGRIINSYSSQIIRGSLQSEGSNLSQNKSNNSLTHNYKFYCKSLYRINMYDIIQYKDNYYMVNSVSDYDEWGVREASLSMIDPAENKDLSDYISYLNGNKIV